MIFFHFQFQKGEPFLVVNLFNVAILNVLWTIVANHRNCHKLSRYVTITIVILTIAIYVYVAVLNVVWTIVDNYRNCNSLFTYVTIIIIISIMEINM